MKEVAKLDLGSVKVHKRVLAEIVQSALSDVKGVRLVPREGLFSWGGIFAPADFSGVGVLADKNNQVTVEVRILIEYGLSIPDTARQIQDCVRAALKKTAAIEIKDVHVNIQGIFRSGS